MAEIDDLSPDLDCTPEPKESDAPLGQNGLKALQKERANNKQLQEQIKQYEDIKIKFANVDLNEYEELKLLKEKTEQEKQATNQQFKELAEKKQADLDAAKTNLNKLEKELAENRKKTAIQRYYYANGGKEDDIDATNKSSFDILYENVLKNRIQVEADGSIVVLDISGLAEDRKDDGRPKTPKDLILELTDSRIWGHFFDKPDIRGTGITQGVKGRAGNRESFEDMVKRIQRG